jgi:hypothetical protein
MRRPQFTRHGFKATTKVVCINLREVAAFTISSESPSPTLTHRSFICLTANSCLAEDTSAGLGIVTPDHKQAWPV